jgi:hypothetical protein
MFLPVFYYKKGYNTLDGIDIDLSLFYTILLPSIIIGYIHGLKGRT